jgi:DNA-binding NtrC family response regulator
MQAGLLRVLQEMTVRPVGGEEEVKVDVRVVASTHRNLEEMVKAGAFREDLFYRLHVVEVRVPPLRERVGDVAPLVAHFISIFAARYRRESKVVGREALRRLASYAWPGNVRQLEHVLLAAWLMSESSEIEATDFELPGVPGGASTPSAATRTKGKRRADTVAEQKELEREQILEALTAASWNRARAAELLGVPRRTFYRRLKEFEILR